MAIALTIRCPFCLHGFETLREGSVNRELRCPRCARPFLFRNALPAAKAPSGAGALDARTPPAGSLGPAYWVLAAAAGALVVGAVRHWSPNLLGPEFLFLYIGLLMLLLAASGVPRATVKDVDECASPCRARRCGSSWSRASVSGANGASACSASTGFAVLPANGGFASPCNAAAAFFAPA